MASIARLDAVCKPGRDGGQHKAQGNSQPVELPTLLTIVDVCFATRDLKFDIYVWWQIKGLKGRRLQ